MRHKNLTNDELIREAREVDDPLVRELTKRLALVLNELDGEWSKDFGTDNQPQLPVT